MCYSMCSFIVFSLAIGISRCCSIRVCEFKENGTNEWMRCIGKDHGLLFPGFQSDPGSSTLHLYIYTKVRFVKVLAVH